MYVEKLKVLIELGVTVQAIADGIGVSRTTVNGWVNGGKLPSAGNEAKVAAYLDRFRKTILEKI